MRIQVNIAPEELVNAINDLEEADLRPLAKKLAEVFSADQIWSLVCAMDLYINVDLIKTIYEVSRTMLEEEGEISDIEKLEVDVAEAEKLISALLGAPPPRIWKKWPNIHAQANNFLHRNDKEQQ